MPVSVQSQLVTVYLLQHCEELRLTLEKCNIVDDISLFIAERKTGLEGPGRLGILISNGFLFNVNFINNQLLLIKIIYLAPKIYLLKDGKYH